MTLLGIPGDNTYSNYQEAQRAFWRQTVLPLVNRTARALSGWLSPAFVSGSGDTFAPSSLLAERATSDALNLLPDLDSVEALSSEREALWARLERTTFLTANEKRAAVGYEPIEPAPETPNPDIAAKYSTTQPRVSSGNSDGGQWTDGGGGSGRASGGSGSSSGGSGDSGRVLSDANPDDFSKPGTQLVQQAGRRQSGSVRVGGRQLSATAQQEAALQRAALQAQIAARQVRERDPDWKPEPSMTASVDGEIARFEAEARQAESRLAEMLHDSIPNTNPQWGVNRLRKELNAQGYVFEKTTDAPGLLYNRPETNEQVRIMARPRSEFRNESSQKHRNDYYYRYRPGKGKGWGSHITILDKKQESE